MRDLEVVEALETVGVLRATAADGPAITVTGVANFGGPRIGDTNSVGFDFNQGIWQVIDNITLVRGKHSYKAGIDAQFVSDERVRGERFFYTFPTSDAYLAANGGDGGASALGRQLDAVVRAVRHEVALGEALHRHGHRPRCHAERVREGAGLRLAAIARQAVDRFQGLALGARDQRLVGFDARKPTFHARRVQQRPE